MKEKLHHKNQCDGCMSGMSINDNGIHIDRYDKIYMVCSKNIYEKSVYVDKKLYYNNDTLNQEEESKNDNYCQQAKN